MHRPLFFHRPFHHRFWWRPSWHLHHRRVFFYPTFLYLPWSTTYYRTVAQPVYSTTYNNTYITQVPPLSGAEQIVGDDPCPFTPQRAWEHIAEGDGPLALEAFACLAREYPDDGLMHIGYALASSLVGAEQSAVAMARQAVYSDVEALLYVPADSRIDERVAQLLDRYGQIANEPGRQGDGLFMIAVLRASVGDYGGAYFAASEAVKYDAADDAAAILQNMLARQLTEEVLGEG